MYKGGNHIALTEQDKKLLEEYERITERNVISITIDEEKTSGITDSKFGGVPYWDMQKEYPKSDKGEMLMMLAQINLDELNRDGYNPMVSCQRQVCFSSLSIYMIMMVHMVYRTGRLRKMIQVSFYRMVTELYIIRA